MCVPGVIKAEQNDTPTKDKIPQLEPQNIRESILDFTALFGEIKPDMPYLCRRGLTGLKRKVLPFALCSKRADEKNVKSLIFRKKTSNF